MDRIAALIERQPKGSPLLQEFYSDPEIFRRDIDRIHLRHWLCVGHESRVPKKGDWFRFDVAGESLILVRGRDDEVRALVNVCRHRGSRVCYEESGNARMLVCPYHAWTYDDSGSLVTVYAEEDFGEVDKACHGLTCLPVNERAGMIWVTKAMTLSSGAVAAYASNAASSTTPLRCQRAG